MALAEVAARLLTFPTRLLRVPLSFLFLRAYTLSHHLHRGLLILRTYNDVARRTLRVRPRTQNLFQAFHLFLHSCTHLLISLTSCASSSKLPCHCARHPNVEHPRRCRPTSSRPSPDACPGCRISWRVGPGYVLTGCRRNRASYHGFRPPLRSHIRGLRPLFLSMRIHLLLRDRCRIY